MEPFGLTRPPLKKRWRTMSWASRKIPTVKTTINSQPTIPNWGGLRLALFRIGISLEFGSPFFVFLACDVTSGISPLKEL